MQIYCELFFACSYFKKFPEHQQSFPAFKNMPIDQLNDNKKFQAHCAGIIATISTVIDSLQDFDLLVANITVFAERHRKRGQTVKSFEVYMIIFIIKLCY